LPVLKARKAFRFYAVHEEVCLETTDPLAVIDIPAFCNENGHELVKSQEMEDHHRFIVRKGET
jgi:tRNA 2-thiouridine synthesizing protein A